MNKIEIGSKVKLKYNKYDPKYKGPLHSDVITTDCIGEVLDFYGNYYCTVMFKKEYTPRGWIFSENEAEQGLFISDVELVDSVVDLNTLLEKLDKDIKEYEER